MLVRATVTHRFPPQALFLLAGLEAQEGPAAAVGVATLLDRLDALAADPRRQETRGRSRDARVAGQAGLGDDERTRLHALVEVVRKPTATRDGSTRTEEGNHLAHLSRLRAWYDEWSTICRAAVRRQEHLVKLGLAGTRAS